MGTPQQPPPVLLFVAIMYDKDAPLENALDRIMARFGPVEARHGPLPFSWSDYYEQEMGTRLMKAYYCFQQPIDREDLPAIKLWTNVLEHDLASDGKRTINIDPGYLCRDKLVLASTKDFYHRLYLGSGIYAEVTLHFRQGRFRYFSWTYPDFKEEKLQEFMMKIRAKMVGEQRKKQQTA
ncbi:MAG: DUF4416 family protein [Chitinispirillaceae bacterium]|nr:DUF4416 family protein [Chitinispirillaceae bacterium]